MAEMIKDIVITAHVDTTELDAAIEKAKLLIELLARAEQMSNSQESKEFAVTWKYGKVDLQKLAKIVEGLDSKIGGSTR